jgi:GAF domain-containing protein
LSGRGWQVDDAARLRTLRECDIISTGPDVRFDRLAANAAESCAAPVAVINFIDADRQFFKSRHGTDMAEPSLDESVCRHCLAEGGTLVIGDLTEDYRTRSLSFVAGDPALRFYAGVPIVVEGQGIGVLSVMDDEPRPQGLSPEQIAALRRCARLISDMAAN